MALNLFSLGPCSQITFLLLINNSVIVFINDRASIEPSKLTRISLEIEVFTKALKLTKETFLS